MGGNTHDEDDDDPAVEGGLVGALDEALAVAEGARGDVNDGRYLARGEHK